MPVSSITLTGSEKIKERLAPSAFQSGYRFLPLEHHETENSAGSTILCHRTSGWRMTSLMGAWTW